MLGSAFVVLLAVAIVAIVVTAPGRVTAFTASPASLVKAGTQQLLAAPMVRYRGTLLDQSGQLVRLDATFTHSGDALLDARLVEGSGHAQIVLHEYRTIIRADRGWWLTRKADNAGSYANRWVEENNGLTFDPHSLLSPQRLAITLRAGLFGKHAAGKHASSSVSARPASARRAATIAGTRVAAVAIPSHSTVYVSEHRPFRILGLDGPLLDSTDAENGMADSAVTTAPQVAFDVSVPDKKTQETLTKQVTSTWHAALAGSKTPPAESASFDVDEGHLSCDSGGCTISASVKRDEYGPAKARAVFLGRLFTHRDGSGPVGSCYARSRPVARYASAHVSCLIRDQRLANVAGQIVWGDTIAYDQAGLGVRPERMLPLFERGLFTADIPVSTSPETVTLIDAWSGSDWSLSKVAEEVDAASSTGMFPTLYRLQQSGKFRFEAKSLTELVDAAGSAPGGREWDAIEEAARRCDKTDGTVSVGSWQDTSGLRYHADVIDTGARESVQIAALRSDASPSATRHQITRAADRFLGNSTPSGYHRVLRVVLAPGHSLYRADRAGIRAGLRAAGLTAGQLNGARLTVVGQHGTSTFTAADLR